MSEIKLTDELLKQAAGMAAETELEQYQKSSRHYFSRSFHKRMRTEIAQSRKVPVLSGRMTRRKAVLLVAVIALMVGVTAVGTSPWSEKIGNLEFNGHVGHVVVERQNENSQPVGELIPYEPAKLPEGYTLEFEDEDCAVSRTIGYSNGEKKIYVSQLMCEMVGQINITSSGRPGETVSVLDTQGYLIPGGSWKTLVVEKDGYLFYVLAELPANELIDLVDSISKRRD